MINNEDGELRLCDWQYLICHHTSDCFKIGESVFLKSNPEWPMTVYLLENNKVTCYWNSLDEELFVQEYPSECILQCKFIPLQVYQKKYHICLN